ncbi:MAG: DEAD/DEAH box helicase, partial [Polyangiaceae bacterium]|nr:DEAD/DEAH box helicase [Polyangiaceae bacterium]
MKQHTNHPQTEPAAKGFSPGFAALGLEASLLAALETLGYEEPTPIQKGAIPPLLEGRDLLGQAATGTGKTAAFALPLLQRIAHGPRHRPTALILVPTRELAVQVSEAVQRYGKEMRIGVLALYGGQAMGPQLQALRRGVEVIVATPGRALDHLRRQTLKLADLQIVVLDEADEMLDMGFADELDAILSKLPEEHQTALFSATMSPRILKIAEQHLEKPVKISIERERTAPGTAPKVRQTAYIVQRAFKFQALGRVLDMEAPTSAIVFCRTRLEVDGLVEAMNARGYRAEALHGGFQQEQRDRVMKRFRSGSADLLIATDVAARGLDIEHISHVVNFDLPSEPEAYVHRIGRTGRAGREGVAITFLEPREHRMLRNIQRETGQKIAVATIPTVAELRNRRLELTGLALRETIVAGELDSFRGLVETLSSEFDPLDVAAAAAKLAHEANHAEVAAHDEEQDIPQEPLHEQRGPRDVRARW